MGDTNNYKKFTLKQRIKELEKALKRTPEDQKRQGELENLKKELDETL